jgi:hypothetical protein
MISHSEVISICDVYFVSVLGLKKDTSRQWTKYGLPDSKYFTSDGYRVFVEAKSQNVDRRDMLQGIGQCSLYRCLGLIPYIAVSSKWKPEVEEVMYYSCS